MHYGARVRLPSLLLRARARPALATAAANLRILVGFAFLPAGLKKVLGQPFTDPGNHGPFHEFLHAFHATGGFYRFVGMLQLVAAALLMTQRGAVHGARLMLPIITAICALCWSTAVYPTATVTTLILLAVLGLVVWDLAGAQLGPSPALAAHDPRPWERCGAAILALYLGACAVSGGVYRPRGVDLAHPGFYVLLVIAVLPLATLAWTRRAARARRGAAPGERPGAAVSPTAT